MAKPGDAAPDVTLYRDDGSPVQLRELVGQRTLVLYFYPKDETPGCTAEACSFRDAYEDFLASGADVVGVSADSGESHQAFKAHHRLPFTLLSDRQGAAAKALGVKRTLGLMPGRVTFVIGKDGVVRHRFESQLQVKKHIAEALELVRTMEKAAA
jgi:peroxiredoxin Q/BCP